MKRYETIVIIDPDLSKEAETPILDRVNDLIPQLGGTLIETDDWGTRKLAYDIKKKNRGHYVRIDFCGDGPLVQEMERFFKIDDKVIKFMTVLLEENADPDAILAEMAEKTAKDEEVSDEVTVEVETAEQSEIVDEKTADTVEDKSEPEESQEQEKE